MGAGGLAGQVHCPRGLVGQVDGGYQQVIAVQVLVLHLVAQRVIWIAGDQNRKCRGLFRRDRQTDRQRASQPASQPASQTERERQRDRERQRETEREDRERETDRQTGRQTESQPSRQREREKGRRG